VHFVNFRLILDVMRTKIIGLFLIAVSTGAGPELLGQVTTSVGEAFNECPIFVPTAFTPNGDTRNDFWGVQINPSCREVEFNLRVFDRWGRLLFHARESGERFWWNGRDIDDQRLRADIYLWQLDAIFMDPSDREHVKIQRKGTVALIR
jgi:gliding motility-associated-like protein